MPARVAALGIDTVDLAQVEAVFGEPLRYIWGRKTFKSHTLPDQFIAVYPKGFRVSYPTDES